MLPQFFRYSLVRAVAELVQNHRRIAETFHLVLRQRRKRRRCEDNDANRCQEFSYHLCSPLMIRAKRSAAEARLQDGADRPAERRHAADLAGCGTSALDFCNVTA